MKSSLLLAAALLSCTMLAVGKQKQSLQLAEVEVTTSKMELIPPIKLPVPVPPNGPLPNPKPTPFPLDTIRFSSEIQSSNILL